MRFHDMIFVICDTILRKDVITMKNNCKKGLAILLAVLMLVCAFPFAAFANGETPAHTHTYNKEVKDAKYLKEEGSCTKKAVYYKSCECGASSSESGAAEPATFEGDYKHGELELYRDEVPATCTSKGWTAIKTCKLCNKPVGGDEIPMVPHTVGTPANCVDKAVCSVCKQPFGNVDKNNHKTIVKDAMKPATCKETGLTEGSHCSACNTTITAQQVVPLAAHTPKTVNTPATCTEDGIQNKMICSVCEAVLEAGTVLPKTGHKWGDWVAPAGYSCDVGGTLTRTCSACKANDTVTKKAGEHAAVVDAAVRATCTADGKEEGSHCGICKAVIKEQKVAPALGHEFTGEVKPNKDGTHSFKCVRCGEIGGTVNCVDKNRDCVCDLCREAIPHTFSVYTPDGNATCLQDGTKTSICDICGKAKDTQPDVGSKDRAEHQFKFVAQNDATCLTNAHELGTCTLCGTTMTREIENTALGHDVSDWQYPDDFSCPLGSYRFKTCKRCGDELERETVAPTEHTKVTDPAVKETCTTDGKTEGSHCSVCGEIFIAQAVIPAPGHKADAKGFTTVTVASCEKDGEEQATCSVCGQSFTRAIPATGHKYVSTVVPPTCTAKGYTNHKCTACGKTFNDSVVKATGHSWKITVKPATMKKAGAKVYVCNTCGKKVTKTIDMIKVVKLTAKTYAKTGKKVTPTLLVKNSAGKKLKEGTAYTVKYSGACKKLGTYTVTVTFIGNYSGSKALKFTIVPAAPKTVKTTVSGKNVTVKWSKVSGGDKYIVYTSTSKNGSYKKVGTTTGTSLVLKNVKAGTYYYKVKAIRVLDTGNLTGVASAAAKAKVK